MAAELTNSAQQVRGGRVAASTLQDSGAFPDVAIKMVRSASRPARCRRC
jgi:type II secretory pathway component PulF